MGDHRHFYDPPACPEGCPQAGTEPLWGWYTLMLMEGFDWMGEAKFPRGVWEDKDGKPTNTPRTVETYGGIVAQPEMAVSNKSTTGKLINAMRMTGWCCHQADEALSKPANAGGAYYGWRCVSDGDLGADFLAHFWAGSFTAEQRDIHLTSHQPPNTSPPEPY